MTSSVAAQNHKIVYLIQSIFHISEYSFILGSACHYLLLLLCFWLLCYVTNTFLLLVLDKHHIFTSPIKLHVTQLILCAILPFIFVAICLFVEKPGYKMMFKDRMAILPSSYILVFGTVTLPVMLSAGASMTMLVAVLKRIRKVSHDPTTAGQVIRSEEERTTLKAVEHHFIAIICLYVFAIIVIFIAEVFLQDQEISYLENILEYFSCLQTDKCCSKPDRPKFFLSSMKILTPGLFCLVTFFLLFYTNETLSIWRGWLHWCCSKARIIGQCFLHWLSECMVCSTGKERNAVTTDEVMPDSVSATRLHDLSSYETRATTLEGNRYGCNNDTVITHL